MNTKIYLLTDGPPDGRYISATFSTREAAQAALPLAGDEGAVEEYAVDAPLPTGPAGLSLWNVQEWRNYSAVRLNAFLGAEDIGCVLRDGDSHYVTLWASSKEHALAMGKELIEEAKGV